MEIVNSDWRDIPGDFIPQSISDFHKKILEIMADDRFVHKYIESEISNAGKATICILEKLNFISTSIAAAQDYEYGFAQSLKNDLQVRPKD